MKPGIPLIGADIGSGRSKYTDGTTTGDIPSIAVPKPEERVYGIESARVVRWGEGDSLQEWLVGDAAVAFGNPAHFCNTLRREWPFDPAWLALLYACLDRLAPEGGEINLVTGAPMKWHGDLQEQIISLHSREHHFFIGEKEYRYKMNVEVLPQAIGALVYHAGSLTNLPLKLANADIGTYTTGFSVLRSHMPVARQCGGVEVGTSLLIDELAQYLDKHFKFKTDILTYHEILRTGQFQYQGGMKKIPKEIDTLATRVAKPLLDAMNDLWPNSNEMDVLIGGGGASFFLPAIKQVIPHAKIMKGGIYAVVEGMHAIAQGQLADAEPNAPAEVEPMEDVSSA